MNIRFISSLTAEDEDLYAAAVLKSVSALLDQLPIAYTLRIETASAQVFQHSHASPPGPGAEGATPVDFRKSATGSGSPGNFPIRG